MAASSANSSHDPGVPGDDVWLTLDRELQSFAGQRMAGRKQRLRRHGRRRRGDVLALVSTPGYDPNLFNGGLTPQQWRGLTRRRSSTPDQQGDRRTLSAGIDVQAAVRSGRARFRRDYAAFSIHCTGSLAFGNHIFHCWKKHGHGPVDLHRGIAESCDVIFIKSAPARDRRHQAGAPARTSAGPPEIEIPGERGGFIPGRAWKQATYRRAMAQGETLEAGIGQGYVLATPLQLCTMAARIASGIR